MEAVARFVAFGALISLTSFVTRRACGGLEGSATDVPLRPPGWVFGVVWPILFVTTGIAWATASGGELDVPLSIVTALCCAWLVVYSCLGRKGVAAGVLVSSCLAAGFSAAVGKRNASRWLLAPLVAWTAFASYLNLYDAVASSAPCRA